VNQKTIFYILIAFVVFFVVTQLFMSFGRKPPFEIVYYRSRMEYDYDGSATFTATAGLYFKDKQKEEEYKKQYAENSAGTFQEYFDQVSEKVGREISVISVDSTISSRSGVLEVIETARLSNIATVQDGLVDTSLKDISIYSVKDSEVTMALPRDAIVVSAQPTPTKVVENQLYWYPQEESMVFPAVRFKKGED